MTTAGGEPRGGLRRLLLGTPDSIGGSVYGTIVVMGAVAASSTDAHGLISVASIVDTTVIVLWLAHVYAHGLGESIGRGRKLDRAELGSVARRELAIPLAAVVPTVVLVIGAAKVVADETAVWIALGIGLATLGVQGLRYAGLERLSRRATALSVAANVALGLVIVALKAAVLH